MTTYTISSNGFTVLITNQIKNLTAGLYKSLQAIDSDLTTVYKNFYHKMASESDDERIYKKPTKQEIARQKTWDELVQIRKDLFLKRDKSDNAFMRYLVASLYTKLPPLRQEEWIGSAFSDNGTNNYLDIDKKILVLRNYKTKKQYGKRVITIPDSLIITMKKYKKRFNTNLVVCKVTDPYKAMSCAGIAFYLRFVYFYIIRYLKYCFFVYLSLFSFVYLCLSLFILFLFMLFYI